jgi:ubiquinone/menaquinone biosynthesis C-methylase UbiE
MSDQEYWKKFLGIEVFKIDHYFKSFLYRLLKIRLPKLRCQKDYWADRGRFYMNDIFSSGYLEREAFFQDMLVGELKNLEFESLFEAGCGFGWNIKRVKDDFSPMRVGGVDFSLPQLGNLKKKYMSSDKAQVSCGDATKMPFCDNAFDIGISVGVFMNIHPSKIQDAIKEMTRVSKKYIIHLEYDDNHTTKELKEQRAIKTNIVSHDYKTLYQNLGKKTITFKTHTDFSDEYYQYQKKISSRYKFWIPFEGPEKYIFIVVEV